MRSSTFLFAFLVLFGNAQAGTVCTNGVCFTCAGSSVCFNGSCSCNGAHVSGANIQVQQRPCGGQPTAIHRNGGGTVATDAVVDASVYMSGDSAVCGNAVVSGLTRLLNGSVVNGPSNVSDQSSLDHSTVNGAATVSDSTLSQSIVSGSAKVSRSQVVSSTLNGRPVVTDSIVTGSVVMEMRLSSAAGSRAQY
jgi:hypothetical protein